MLQLGFFPQHLAALIGSVGNREIHENNMLKTTHQEAKLKTSMTSRCPEFLHIPHMEHMGCIRMSQWQF